MDDILYAVRVTGLGPSRLSPEQVRAAYAALFCLTEAEAAARLAALPLVVRGDLPLEQAAKYQRVLSRAGLACEILPQPAAGQPPAPAPLGEGA